jgi:hypothetical protein
MTTQTEEVQTEKGGPEGPPWGFWVCGRRSGYFSIRMP